MSKWWEANWKLKSSIELDRVRPTSQHRPVDLSQGHWHFALFDCSELRFKEAEALVYQMDRGIAGRSDARRCSFSLESSAQPGDARASKSRRAVAMTTQLMCPTAAYMYRVNRGAKRLSATSVFPESRSGGTNLRRALARMRTADHPRPVACSSICAVGWWGRLSGVLHECTKLLLRRPIW